MLDTFSSAAVRTAAWASESPTDPAWDAFLQQTPLGHFQQSTIWAAVKADEGWKPVRVIVWQEEVIVGGFQILTRARRGVREGFLNKGPVYPGEDPKIRSWLVALVQLQARSHGISLLMTQPPDLDEAFASIQRDHGFAANALAQIVNATVCVPLGAQLPPVESRMRRSIQLDARQSVRRGLTVREAGAPDVPVFFDLMGVTCRRQQTHPNPASPEAMLKLWEEFHRRGLGRLTLAEFEGKPTAGLLTLRFGRRITAWKKGWNEENRDKHPNTLLTFESIKWAEMQRAATYDFGAFDRTFARQMLAGQVADERLRASRFFYLLGFAALPQLLPLAQVWIKNPIARTAYRTYVAWQSSRNKLEF